MADESPINTFSFSVKLPILIQSPPIIFFKVNIFCNGNTFTSPEFDNADDALDFVTENWSEFGDWDIDDDDVLNLTNSLCSTGRIWIDQFNESAEGDDGLILYLDSSSPQTINDIFGITFSDISVNNIRATDTTFVNHMIQCHPVFSDQFPDPEGAQWWHTTSGTENGYGILASECAARGKPNPATYAYSFITDYANTLQAIGITQTVLTVNLASLLIQVMGNARPINAGMISFTTFTTQFTYIKNLFTSKGITIRSVQLCTELGIGNQSDIVKESNDVKVVCDYVIDWLHTNYPAITSIVSDAYQADDLRPRLPDYQSTMNALNTSGVRNYFQFNDELDTYQKNRDRIAEFHDYVSTLKALFPSKTIHFRQAAVQIGNPMRSKVGDGLINFELFIRVVEENLTRGGLIHEWVVYNINRMINQSNVVFPLMAFVKLGRGIFDNDGKIEATLDDNDIVKIAVKNGLDIEVYLLNPTENFKTISQTQLNGQVVSVLIESLYGEPEDTEQSEYTTSGNEILLHPYSASKVTL